jgi:hypothetical protein
MLQRAVATNIVCRRGIASLKTTSAKSSTLSAVNSTHGSKISSAASQKLIFASSMRSRSFAASATGASGASSTKSSDAKPLEFYKAIDVEAERRVLEADLPKYDDAVIAAARAESDDYKRKGKAPAALIAKKIMYSYYAAGDYARAHLAFLDLNSKEQPTLYDFNLVFVYQSIAKDFQKIHEVCFCRKIARKNFCFAIFSKSLKFFVLCLDFYPSLIVGGYQNISYVQRSRILFCVLASGRCKIGLSPNRFISYFLAKNLIHLIFPSVVLYFSPRLFLITPPSRRAFYSSHSISCASTESIPMN